MSCPHLESEGFFFTTYRCGVTGDELDSTLVNNLCNTSRDYYNCRYNKSDSGCFITTAVMTALGKDDDCVELQTMRAVRDNWLAKQSDGPQLIEEYYRIAPGIVAAIDILPERGKVYADIYSQWLAPCLEAVSRQEYEEAKALYTDMVRTLRSRYGSTSAGVFRPTNPVQ